MPTKMTFRFLPSNEEVIVDLADITRIAPFRRIDDAFMTLVFRNGCKPILTSMTKNDFDEIEHTARSVYDISLVTWEHMESPVHEAKFEAVR